jgi:hypothetical protein
MSTVEEIETAIEGLKERDVLRLAEWLKAKLAETWDRRIALDANEGKLDFLFHEAEAERAGGELRDRMGLDRNPCGL